MAMPDGQALARKQQKEFTDTLAVLVQNPGMSFQKAAELTNYKPGTEIDDPAYQSTVDRSANFNWGADLPYDPNVYANSFDWQGYIAANPDLKAAGIDTPWEAATHYSNYGKNENRAGVKFYDEGVVVRPGGFVDYSGRPVRPEPPPRELTPAEIQAQEFAALRSQLSELQSRLAAPPPPPPPPPPPAIKPPPVTPGMQPNYGGQFFGQPYIYPATQQAFPGMFGGFPGFGNFGMPVQQFQQFPQQPNLFGQTPGTPATSVPGALVNNALSDIQNAVQPAVTNPYQQQQTQRFSDDYNRFLQSNQPFNQPVMGYNTYGQIFAPPRRPQRPVRGPGGKGGGIAAPVPPPGGKGGGFRQQPPAIGSKGRAVSPGVPSGQTGSYYQEAFMSYPGGSTGPMVGRQPPTIGGKGGTPANTGSGTQIIQNQPAPVTGGVPQEDYYQSNTMGQNNFGNFTGFNPPSSPLDFGAFNRSFAFQEGGQVPPDAVTSMDAMLSEAAPADPQAEMSNEYDRLIQMTMQAVLGQIEQPDEIIQMFIDEFGVDSFRQLRDAVLKQQVPNAQTEGMVDGNGGGMDDQVMGMIGAQRPVAVSPGEYIIPADVVSGLGDGSSKSGADILDELSQAVRMARTGTTEQPRPLMETLSQ